MMCTGHMWSAKYFQCQCFPEDDDWHNHQKEIKIELQTKQG